MNKPLLLSLVTATILTTSLNAQSMYERIQGMELQMKQLQGEITTLKENEEKMKTTALQAEEEKEETSADSDDDENEAVVADDEEEDDASVSSDDEDDASADSDDEDDDDEESIEDTVSEMEESITDLNKNTNGNHLKFKADYRFAIDNLQYKMAGKDASGEDTRKNDAFMTNRLWLNMNWKATENLSFTAQMAYQKAFGARSGWNSNMVPMETFDWITNENPYDGTLRIRSAYFLYKNDTFMSADIPWTFSIGRRPSTNGHLVNLRDDDGSASPMGHNINVEFDGLSSKFAFDDLTGIDGMYFKFCAGRGLTNASPRFFAINPSTGQAIANGAPYSKNRSDIPDIDLAGLIFVPYNDGQYGIATQYYYANNLIDADMKGQTLSGYKTVGGMHAITANFTMNGIGDEWSDYLDDTFFFVSGAMSITNPKSDQRMLYGASNLDGTTNKAGESKTGYSVWAGLQMPSIFTEEGKWGLEYNKGSQYWRSITYGEDTAIGSKLAARGSAYEAYFTEPLIEDILSIQLRYTYVDYDYTGSAGFFGDTTGTAMSIKDIQAAAAAGSAQMAGYASQIVDKAQDIRFYIRYRY